MLCRPVNAALPDKTLVGAAPSPPLYPLSVKLAAPTSFHVVPPFVLISTTPPSHPSSVFHLCQKLNSGYEFTGKAKAATLVNL